MKRKKRRVYSMFKIFCTYICWIIYKMQLLEVSGVVWHIYIYICRSAARVNRWWIFLSCSIYELYQHLALHLSLLYPLHPLGYRLNPSLAQCTYILIITSFTLFAVFEIGDPGVSLKTSSSSSLYSLPTSNSGKYFFLW